MQQDDRVATVEEVAREFEGDASTPMDFSQFTVEDWVALVLFWAMAVCVALQFFTRYALNNSLSWTEEVASNLLVLVVFIGSITCVRLSRHIQVDFLYRYLPPRASRVLSLAVDVVKIGFFAYAAVLVWRYLPAVVESGWSRSTFRAGRCSTRSSAHSS